MLQNYNRKIELIKKAITLKTQNYNYKQIATELNINHRTVKKYINFNYFYSNSRNRISNLNRFDSIIINNLNKRIKKGHCN